MSKSFPYVRPFSNSIGAIWPGASGPQMHSRDGYVRIRDQDLGGLSWSHLVSDGDPSGGRQGRSGCVEWVASHHGAVLSLAWDWIQSGGAPPRVDLEAGFRTNIKVIDLHGYDLPWQESHPRLLMTIESLDWRRWVTVGRQTY